MILRDFVRALVLLAVAASAVSAQTPVRPGPEGWTRTRVAKWALLGAAVGFGGYALVQTSRAQDRYDALGRICVNEPDRCQLDAGRYRDAELERLYQETNTHDRRAQVGIVSAQVALFGSVALFIYDLRNGRGPRDIPYPSLGAGAAPARWLALGARVAF